MNKWIILLFATYSALLSNVFAQTWQEYYQTLKPKEVIANAQRNIDLIFNDKRWTNNLGINRELLQKEVENRLSNLGYSVTLNGEKSNELSIVINVIIDYLNFYESSAGNLFGKGILVVKMDDKLNSNLDAQQTVTSDLYVPDYDENDLKNPENKIETQRKMLPIISQLTDRFIEKCKDFLENSKDYIKEVIVFGKSDKIKPIENAKRLAILDALQNGCEKAWGISLENVSTLIDFSSVTDVTTITSNGIILKYEVLPQFTKVTTDNYYCILLKALIQKPK